VKLEVGKTYIVSKNIEKIPQWSIPSPEFQKEISAKQPQA